MTRDMTLISVIIPVRNNAGMVGQAIESALDQTYRDIEVVVVDDGSEDATPEVLKEYADRVKVIRQDQAGVSSARNRGISESTGQLLAFLDADDLWLPDKLSKQYALFQAQPDMGIVHCDGWVVMGEEVPEDVCDQPTFYAKQRPPHSEKAAGRLMHTPIITSHVIMRRSVLEKAGGFDEQLSLHEDADLWLRAIECGAVIGYIGEPLVIKRELPASQSRSFMEYCMASIRVQERSWNRSESLRSVLRPTLARSHALLSREYLAQGDWEQVRHNLHQSLSYRRKDTGLWLALLLSSMPIDSIRKISARFLP